MDTSGRPGSGGIDDPEIRRPEAGGIEDPDIRPGGAEVGDRVTPRPPTTIDPGSLASVSSGISSGGKGAMAVAFFILAAVADAVAYAALQPAAPGASPGASVRPVTNSPVSTPGSNPGSAAAETVNLVVTGADVSGSWTLDGGADVSPTTELIAAVWTETVDNVDAGYADLVVLSMGGPVFEGTQATSAAGISISISISQFDAQGTDLFDHTFASSGGECQVTMQRTATGVSGTFTCTGIKDADGHTADASGSFAT